MPDKKAFFVAYIPALLFFLSMAFLGEQMGVYSHALNRLYGCLLLLLYLFGSYKQKQTTNNHRLNEQPVAYAPSARQKVSLQNRKNHSNESIRKKARLRDGVETPPKTGKAAFYALLNDSVRSRIKVLVITVLYILILIAPLPVMSVSFMLLIAFIYRTRQSSLVCRVGMLFFLYFLLHSYWPAFFFLERAVADGLNALLNAVSSMDIHFSPSAYGLGYLLIILSLAVLSPQKSRPKKKELLFSLVTLFAAFLLYLGLAALYFSASCMHSAVLKPRGYGLDGYFYSLIGSFLPMQGHFIIFTVLLVTLALLKTALQQKQKRNTKKKRIREYTHAMQKSYSGMYILSALILSFTLFIFYWNIDWTGGTFNLPQKKPVVYVYDTGMDFKKVPNNEVFGVKNGMFAMLFDYLRDWGYQTELGVDWEHIDPENHDTVVLINPHGELNQKEKDRFLSFLKAGGRFFILGDHNFMFGLQNDYFEFTKELGIAFNFDTAIYFRSRWTNCLRSPFPTWNKILTKDGYSTHIVQGASLNVTIPAVPLVIGQFGWSDTGDLSKESGYLGDRIYSPHEPTGDIVLAAERQYGRGKIIVFGDTSFIQNSPLSLAYPLLRLCLAQLLPKNRIFLRILPAALLGCSSLALWILGFLLVKKTKKRELEHLWPIQALLLIGFIWIGSIIGSGAHFFNLPEYFPDAEERERAGIDFTHFNDYFQVDWYAKDRGLGGFKNSIYRAGMLPYLIYQYPQGGRVDTDLLFLIAPNRRIGKREALGLEAYIRRGGSLVLAAGFENRDQVRELLALFKLDILDIPLSNLAGEDTDRNLRFVSAWPIAFEASGKVDILCQAWQEYPVIIKKNLNAGRFILIGDSHFFENRNLESNDSYYRYNSIFVEELIIDSMNSK